MCDYSTAIIAARQHCAMPKNLKDILDGIPQQELEEYLDRRKGER
jgi:hypothetical protein